MSDALTDSERPLVAHLLELRSRLLRGVVGLLLALACLLPFSNKLYGLLAQPLLDKLPKGGQLIATQVASPFFAPMKLAFFAATIDGLTERLGSAAIAALAASAPTDRITATMQSLIAWSSPPGTCV